MHGIHRLGNVKSLYIHHLVIQISVVRWSPAVRPNNHFVLGPTNSISTCPTYLLSMMCPILIITDNKCATPRSSSSSSSSSSIEVPVQVLYQ